MGEAETSEGGGKRHRETDIKMERKSEIRREGIGGERSAGEE